MSTHIDAKTFNQTSFCQMTISKNVWTLLVERVERVKHNSETCDALAEFPFTLRANYHLRIYLNDCHCNLILSIAIFLHLSSHPR